MNQPIRAIETRYAGCRFRSRLEARWAVFFDALDIPWDFEAQGFHTPAGGYLPDFFLPEEYILAEGEGMYVEIKGPPPGEQELAKCQAINNLIILVGSIPRRPEEITWWIFALCAKGPLHLLHRCDSGWVISKGWPFGVKPSKEQVQEALTRARSARFEHGENGS